MAEEAEEKAEDGRSKKPNLILLLLFGLVVVLIIILINMYLSVTTATHVAQRESKAGEVVLEEEKKTVAILPLPGDNKDKSFNAHISKGEEASSLMLQIRLSLGVSNASLDPVINQNQDPLKDRVLAYFSQKSKRDILYAFQRKVLGEEIKEILNAILEYDLGVKEDQGRITSVHVTKLLFIPN